MATSAAVERVLADELEQAIEDPAQRARIIAAVQSVGGNSRYARVIKILAFVGAAIGAIAFLPLQAGIAIGGAFGAAAIAEIRG